MQIPIIVLVFAFSPSFPPFFSPSILLLSLTNTYTHTCMSKWPLSLSLFSKLSVTRGFSLAFLLRLLLFVTQERAREREGGMEGGEGEDLTKGGKTESERVWRGLTLKDKTRLGDREIWVRRESRLREQTEITEERIDEAGEQRAAGGEEREKREQTEGGEMGEGKGS